MKKFNVLMITLIVCTTPVVSDSSFSAEAPMNNSQSLTSEDVTKYLKDLERDPDKEFQSEFVRTTDLELALINQFGFSGLKLVFAKQNSENYYQLGDFPAESPWHKLNGLRPEKAIDTIFEPVSNKLPELLSIMKQRIRFIYTEKVGEEWRLHYLMNIRLYDQREYFHVYTGGAPNSAPTENDTLRQYKWRLPKDLAEFYSVHDGFGDLDSSYISSNKQLTVMGEMMNPIAKQQNVFPDGYTFNDLLEFMPDGSGNAQCFLRVGREAKTTVDWDHEVWEISEGTNFYDFVDYRLAQLDEE